MEEKDKLSKVIDLIDHPERYTDEMIRDLMMDSECAEYYHLLSSSKSAYEAMKANEDCSEQFIQAEWERFEHNNSVHEKHHSFSWRKIAAILVECVALSGLTIASLSYFESKKVSETVQTHTTESGTTTRASDSTSSPCDSITNKAQYIKTFDNARLDDVLSEVAKYYGAKLEYEDNTIKDLRLHIVWNKDQDVSVFIATLNGFDQVHAEYTDNTISVK